jgi:hypothetical protein
MLADLLNPSPSAQPIEIIPQRREFDQYTGSQSTIEMTSGSSVPSVSTLISPSHGYSHQNDVSSQLGGTPPYWHWQPETTYYQHQNAYLPSISAAVPVYALSPTMSQTMPYYQNAYSHVPMPSYVFVQSSWPTSPTSPASPNTPAQGFFPNSDTASPPREKEACKDEKMSKFKPRMAKACEHCSQRKKKCSGKATCVRCVRLGLDCNFVLRTARPGPKGPWKHTRTI